MNRILITSIFLILTAGGLLAQEKDLLDVIQPKEPSYVRRGNQAYGDGRYNDAMTYYLKALGKDAESNRALFNLGDSYFQQGNYDTAANAFTRAALNAKEAEDRADAFYNAGNALYKGEKYDKAIESYIRALQANPNHPEARKNLQYAIREMQQQQQQQQQQKGEKGEKTDSEEQSDEESQQSEKGEQQEQEEGGDKQDQKPQDQKEKEDQDQENQPESENSDSDDKQEGKKESAQDQKSGEQGEAQNLSRNQMEALLDRLRQKEQQTIKDVQKRKAGAKTTRAKDW
ncbi:MAG: tetratricopeptide repeat protein [Bacteroidia bacterium]